MGWEGSANAKKVNSRADMSANGPAMTNDREPHAGCPWIFLEELCHVMAPSWDRMHHINLGGVACVMP